MSGDRPEHAANGDVIMVPGELSELLAQIAAEPVPARLLDLALKLQKALAEHRIPATSSDRLEATV